MNRRDLFKGAAATAAVGLSPGGAAAQASGRAWRVRFATHLGLTSLDTPLFKETVGSLDPVAHVRFAAEQGFAGVEDNFLKLRPAAEQERIGRSLADAGLSMGAFVGNIEGWNNPLWGSGSPDARDQLRRDFASTVEAAKRVNGRYVTTITGLDPRVPRALQFAAMTENLKRLVPDAERAGLVLGIETLNDRGFPGMLVNHVTDAYAIVKAVGSPAVKLVFDIHHIQIQDGDVIHHLETMVDEIGLVQVADNPGRAELGSGELNWANILRRLNAVGYRGLVELEHRMSRPGREGEEAALRDLRAINDLI